MKIFIIAILIFSLGILSIYSSTYQNTSQHWKMQVIWGILGIICFIAASGFDYRRIWDFNYVLYAAAVLLLLLVFILGVTRLGAQRWLRLARFNFQPSELVKLIMVIFLSGYFSRKSADDTRPSFFRFGIWRGLILPLIFVAIPVGLIIEQPDLGSGLIVFFMFIAMLYLAGAKLKYLFILLFVIIAACPVFWQFLRDYQKDRLLVFLNPNIDPLGAGYTVIQSKIAIGSAGFFGKGWLSGTQSQLHFLPESHTDFIFATFTEERGILGSGILLLLYYFLVNEGLKIAQKTQDQFGRLLALGISSLLGIQIFINIAMNLGLAPVVGIPLPLLSYGGSSVVVTFIALGILVSIGRRRTVF